MSAPSSPRLLDQVRQHTRLLHYSLRTEDAYVYWVRTFVRFHKLRHPAELAQAEVEAFLSWLVTERDVAPGTHRQALSALLFLYQKVLRKDLPWMADIGRPRQERRLPAVFSHDEVQAVLAQLEVLQQQSPGSAHGLIGRLLYGSGMRLLEGLRLRVKDIDFDRRALVVREGKGRKDRVVMLPAALEQPLRDQLLRAHALWQQDRSDGLAGVHMPHALDRKYPRVGHTWPWQWVFPQAATSVDPRTGVRRRHHVPETNFQRAFKLALGATGIAKPASPHTLRHSFVVCKNWINGNFNCCTCVICAYTSTNNPSKPSICSKCSWNVRSICIGTCSGRKSSTCTGSTTFPSIGIRTISTSWGSTR